MPSGAREAAGGGAILLTLRTLAQRLSAVLRSWTQESVRWLYVAPNGGVHERVRSRRRELDRRPGGPRAGSRGARPLDRAGRRTGAGREPRGGGGPGAHPAAASLDPG